MADIIEFNKNDEQKLNPIQDLKNAMSQMDLTNNEILEPIAMLLALPDEQFALIAPLYIEELQKEYQRPEQEMALAQLFNAGGIKIDDFANQYNALMESLNNELKNELSPQKIDFLKRMTIITYNAVMETQNIDKRFVTIPYTTCHEDAKEPTYAHITDAGMDVCAAEEVTLAPGELKLIATGLKFEIPHGYAILVQARSGLSSKSKLRLANSLGLIDSDYRGEIKVIMENIEPKIKDFELDENGKVTGILYGSSYTIEKGQKIAQLRLVEVPHAVLTKVDEVNETERGEGGFGSTGK